MGGRQPNLAAIRASVDTVGRLSDSIVRMGPVSIGIDGVLSWIPVVGEVYSAAAAAFLLVQGVRARVPASVLLASAALMASRTAVTAIPLAGPAISDFYTAHKWSARMISRAIDRRIAKGDPLRANTDWTGPAPAPAAR